MARGRPNSPAFNMSGPKYLEYYKNLDTRDMKLARLRNEIAARQHRGECVVAHEAVALKICDALPLTEAEDALIPELETYEIRMARLEGKVEAKLEPIKEMVDAVLGLAEAIDGFEGLLKGEEIDRAAAAAVGIVIVPKLDEVVENTEVVLEQEHQPESM